MTFRGLLVSVFIALRLRISKFLLCVTRGSLWPFLSSFGEPWISGWSYYCVKLNLQHQNSILQGSERLLQVGTLPCFPASAGCALIHANFQNNIEETANPNRKLRLYHFIFLFYSFPFCLGSVLTSQGFLANQPKSKLKQMSMITGIQPTRITLLENLFRQNLFSPSYN